MLLILKFIFSSELKAWVGCFCLTGFAGNPAAKLLIALVSQQVNKHSPATLRILQGHKRFLDFSAKPIKDESSVPLKSSLLWKISDIIQEERIAPPLNPPLSFDNYPLKANHDLSVPLLITTLQ